MSYIRDNSNQVFMLADTETENLALIGKNRPWQIAYIVYQNNKIIDEKERFIRWDDLDISDEAAKITRFDWAEYKRKWENPKIVLDDFEKYLMDKSIVKLFHNSHNFDIYIIKNWRESLNLKNDYSYLDDAIDTNALARAIKKGIKKIDRKNWKTVMFRFANYVEKGLKTNLKVLGKEFGIQVDYDNLHRGGNDIKLNILVWEKLKQQIEI